MRFLVFLLTTAAVLAAREQPAVEVFLPPIHGGSVDLAVSRAREVVTEIYSEIGVRVIWRSSASHPTSCSKEPLHRTIVVTLGFTHPERMNDAAMAYSYPYATQGPCVVLLMDRLQNEIRMNPTGTGVLLGHVLAHEIGHVLQGVARHSQSGVMKYRWSSKEVWNMTAKPLHFEARDADLILSALGVS